MSNLLDQVIKSFTTIRAMMEYRGQPIEMLANVGEEELKAMVYESQVFDIPVNDTMKIVYMLYPKFKIAEIREVMTDGLTKVLIVTRDALTPTHHKQYNEEFAAVDTQFFTLKELQVDISKHILVPHHQIVSDPNDVTKIMTQFHVKSKNQFPIILRTDAMARFIDAKSGDLVRIKHVSPSAGEYISYRCCV
jgi:DNA-directed RNA polymerase subunit H (RpoH/RPB5)